VKWLWAIGRFLGEVLKPLLPQIFKEKQKPREVKQAGHDPELQKDMEAELERQIEGRDE